MPLETNFNAAPYFDDYSANANFYRVLFKPAVAVQARELTQMQTILQDQIDKFGRHVFKDGSIVEGCTLNFDAQYQYVKLQDVTSNGDAFTVTDFIGNKVVSSSNLQAVVVNGTAGFEANDPDLNTIYVRYLNSATYANGAQQKTFDPAETLTVQTLDNSNIVTVSVATEGFTPTGAGYAVSISEGTIFKNGFFVRVDPQTLIVSKYDTTPDNISIGFVMREQIITADTDAALYDNALGSTNFNAPGANRLKLIANLAVQSTDTANTADFFSVVNFKDGNPVTLFTNPQYAKIGTEMARRTYEESGNYIVDPFELTCTSNTTNANNLVLEVDKGLGYVYGYRVEFADKNRVTMRKGTDTVYFPNQIITANYGNYVFVNEVAGPFDIRNLDEVSLRDVAATTLTDGDYNPASGSPPGNQIGTAKVRSIQYHSGVPGTPTAVYKLYLFDIVITAAGLSFEDVKSFYATNGSAVPAYADSVLEAGKAVMRETGTPDLLFSIGRSAIQTVNTIATSFIYRTSSAVNFTTGGIGSLSISASAPGGTDTIFPRGSLSETNESRFVVVPNTSVNGAALGVTVSVTSGCTTISSASTFTTNFAVGDYLIVSDGSAGNTNTERVVSITNATHLTVNSTVSFTNTAASIVRRFPAGVPISFQRDDAAFINVASDGLSAVINVGTSTAASFTAYVAYDISRDGAVHASKQINKNRFIKIQANTHPNTTRGPWTLGLPDVHKIRNIYQGTTGTTNDTNRTSQFVLDNGQRGSYYGLASISIKPNSNHTIGVNDILTVELDHFTSVTSSGIGYYSINSYPIDDLNTANTSAIQTADIPLFTSDTGAVYDLRDTIDFRPYYSNTAASSTTTAGATVNPAAASTLVVDGNYGAFTPTPDESFETAFSYYLGRKDKVSLSSEGKINITEGAPAPIPSAPRDIDGSMTLGTVTIPPYPSLSQTEVRLFDRPEYGVSIDLQQYRRYTMRDIGVIDKKIARLEYYTSLSLLESSAKTLSVKDSAGLDRFKNGFIVDPFKGFGVSDTKNPEYKAAIDIKLQELAPTISRTYVDLDFNAGASSNVVKNGNLIQLESNTTPYIDQLFASKTRNCVENIIYTWNGNIELTPEGDIQPDIDVNPDVVGSVDLSGIVDLVNALPSVISPERIISTSTVQDVRSSSVTSGSIQTGVTTTTTRDVFATTTTTTARNELDFSAATLNNTFDFGEVVQDVSIQQFIRPRLIRFNATGLKPNTVVYPFFDGQAVSQFCTPTNSSYVATDTIGGTFQSDSNGALYGTFAIPSQTFKVGERVFRLVDVQSIIVQEDSITTQAASTFIASNIAITKARLKLATRTPQIAINTTTITNTAISSRLISTSTSSVTIPAPRPPTPPVIPPPRPRVPPRDPIAQSFLISEGGENSGVYIDSLDVYFQSKHPTLGVEIQIREMENGFPTLRIVPFGRKVIEPASVTISNNASEPTRFTFDTPVFLRAGEEYCFVVMPVGSNDGYNIWCGELGGTDITTNAPIFVNNSTGVLFTSSTNRVWTPFQKEDIKFVINRRRFIKASGTIVYNNSNSEFLTANNFLGSFYPGETVYVSNGVVAVSANVIGNTTSNTINAVSTGTNTQTLFATNSLVYVSSSNGQITNIRQIVAIPNANQVTLDAPLSFDESNGAIGVLRANGELRGVMLRWNSNSNLMYLEQSTANTTSNFTNAVTGSANALLIGATSGARANLVSVDSVDYSVVIPQFSYIVPAGSTAAIKIKGYDSSLDVNPTTINSDLETFFADKVRNVKSRSLELQGGTGKTLQVTVDVTTDTDRVSPVFDDIKSDILVIKNNISNASSLENEDLPGGGSTNAKYVSKRVVLAEGQDANDLQVYLSAYKPANTEITVFAKFLNGDDSEIIDDKYWTPLQQTTSAAVISSRIDRNDYKEIVYGVPTGVTPNTNPNGYFSVSINTNAGISNTADTIAISAANTYFAPGDLVLYRGDLVGNTTTGISNNNYYHIISSNSTTVQVSDSFNGAAADLVSNTTGTGSGALYLIPFTAYNDDAGSNAVSYFTKDGGLFHGFKTFAIKIVMTSEEGSHLVPRVADMRAIALQ